MRELLDLAEERANELLKVQGRILESQIYDIWEGILRENDERFAEELRKGNITFIDFSQF